MVLPSGEHRPLDDVLGPRFSLVSFEPEPVPALDAASRALVDALRIRLVHGLRRSPRTPTERAAIG